MSERMNQVKPAARRKARRFALQGLYQWQLAGTEPSEIIVQFRTDNDMKKVDIDYFQELLSNIPVHVAEIDGLVEGSIDRKFSELDQIEKAILRISVYEFKYRIDVPYRVVINEGIELAKLFGSDDSHKYVNGVLDKIAAVLRQLEVDADKKSKQSNE